MSSMETYYGYVRTPLDAIILFEACRLGILPRVQRRLSEKERLAIRSGSVFVWDEREAGMQRWTDGKSWSASRVSGSFLTYREMEGKRGGGTYGGPLVASPSDQPREEDSDDSEREGPDGYRYKPDGLMKQSFSIQTSSHLKLHLISYYSRSHVLTGSDLMQPCNDPALKYIRIPKGMYPDATASDPEPLGGPMPLGTPHLRQNSLPAAAAQTPSQGIRPQIQIAPQPMMQQQHSQQPQLAYHSSQAPPHVSPMQQHPQAPPPPQAQMQLQPPAYQYAQQQQQQPPQQQQGHAPPPPPSFQQQSMMAPMLAVPPHTPQQRSPMMEQHLQQQQQQQQQQQIYGWPPSPASTPPNYSIQSISPSQQYAANGAPLHHPQDYHRQQQHHQQQQAPLLQSMQPQMAQMPPVPVYQYQSNGLPVPPKQPLAPQQQHQYSPQHLQQAAPAPLQAEQQTDPQVPRPMQAQLPLPPAQSGSEHPSASGQQYSGSPLGGLDMLTARTHEGHEVQDIPFEKVSWGEDMRAIKALNKSFII